ncbi:hypothetical protein EI94DRAFT_1701047 [Lactarius quietus]|nr:hypothetical protein EI94DRAFT_1701047 [Lactarius quietus]
MDGEEKIGNNKSPSPLRVVRIIYSRIYGVEVLGTPEIGHDFTKFLNPMPSRTALAYVKHLQWYSLLHAFLKHVAQTRSVRLASTYPKVNQDKFFQRWEQQALAPRATQLAQHHISQSAARCRSCQCQSHILKLVPLRLVTEQDLLENPGKAAITASRTRPSRIIRPFAQYGEHHTCSVRGFEKGGLVVYIDVDIGHVPRKDVYVLPIAGEEHVSDSEWPGVLGSVVCKEGECDGALASGFWQRKTEKPLANLGDAGLEFFLECAIPSIVPVTGCIFGPSEYLSHAGHTQVGDIDVTPEEGLIERNLAQSMTSMGNR